MNTRKNDPSRSRTGTAKWKRVAKAAKERDEYRCVKCGRAAEDGFALEVDHIVPWTKGGEDELSNAETLCKAYCHRAKSNKEDAERRMHKPRPTIDWV